MDWAIDQFWNWRMIMNSLVDGVSTQRHNMASKSWIWISFYKEFVVVNSWTRKKVKLLCRCLKEHLKGQWSFSIYELQLLQLELELGLWPRSGQSLRVSVTDWRPFGIDVTTLLKMEWIDSCWWNQISKQCWCWNEVEVELATAYNSWQSWQQL